jgi:Mg2+ and Co2+ transporter CorA
MPPTTTPAPDTNSDPSRDRSTTLNLAEMVAPLLGRTFELRRAYEEKLRLLTELQNEIDVVQSARTPFPRQRQGMENLEHHFRQLAKSTEEAEELLNRIREQFGEIHHESHAIEKEQRER